jgi:DUF971 family protein
MQYLMPTKVKRLNSKQTEITWNDGHVGSYWSWYLRENCPCASCVDEFTGIRKVGHGSIPSSLERVNVAPVGNYALQFEWSDSHNTGIYSFDYLRQLCPCPQCHPEDLEEPPEKISNPGSFEV